jgi:transcriptional regulator with XRE-family HTH domain
MARPAQLRSKAKKARPGTVKSPTDIDREVGKRLRALREEAGISQTALGDGSGITFQQVQKYENGVNRVSVSRLMQFCDVLGVPVSQVLDGIATARQPVNAARLLIDRAIPSRRGAPIHFPLRPLKTAQDCADVLSDLLTGVAQGRLTPDEASQVSGIVSKRAELFGTIELATEIDTLKAQLAAIVGRPTPPTPIRRPFAIT